MPGSCRLQVSRTLESRNSLASRMPGVKNRRCPEHQGIENRQCLVRRRFVNRSYRYQTQGSHLISYLLKETFFLQIGQHGYQKMQNFTLISNPKTESIKSAPINSYFFKKLAK